MAVIAAPVSHGKVAPIFDLSCCVLLATTNGGGDTKKTALFFHRLSPSQRVTSLIAAGVKTLLCGCISEELHNMLQQVGIQVLWGVAGPADEVLEAFLANRLSESGFRPVGNEHTPFRAWKLPDWPFAGRGI